MNLTKILTELKNKAKARVTGSYARGEQRPESDLDIYIPEQHWKEAKAVLNESGLKLESTAIGQLCCKEVDPWLEVSWRFHRQRQLEQSEVTVDGVVLKTW